MEVSVPLDLGHRLSRSWIHLNHDQNLILGSAGLIGSHTSLVLLEVGYELVVRDNDSNTPRKPGSVR
jgi:hypothetical protein